MELYSEKELIDFASYILNKTLETNNPSGVQDAWLQNWKETLKQSRREQKLNELLNGKE